MVKQASEDKAAKKRRGKRAFLSDFRLNAVGQYSYMGNVHRYVGERPYNSERIRLIALTALMIAPAIALGFLKAPSLLGINNFYVVPLLIIELIAVFAAAFAAIRLIAGGSELREYVFEKTVKRLPNVAPIVFYAALACVAANIVYLCLNGVGENPAASFAAVAFHLIIAAAAFLLRRTVEAEKWECTIGDANKPDPFADPDEPDPYSPAEPEQGGAGEE